MYHVHKVRRGIAYRFRKEKITLRGLISNACGTQSKRSKEWVTDICFLLRAQLILLNTVFAELTRVEVWFQTSLPIIKGVHMIGEYMRKIMKR